MGSESRARFLDYFKLILSELFGYFPEGSAVSYEKQMKSRFLSHSPTLVLAGAALIQSACVDHSAGLCC